MNTYNWDLIFQQIKDFYKIIAYDNYADPPIRFYLTPKTAPYGENTWAVLVDFYNQSVIRPTRLGSYTARWCPAIDIRTYGGDLSHFWEKVFTFGDKELLLLHWFTQTHWDNHTLVPKFDEMRLTDFMGYISHIPYLFHSFDIKRANWNVDNATKLIDAIFGSDNPDATVTISRNDLLTEKPSTDIFIIKVLMWGFPTMGRGGYIREFLKDQTTFMSFVNTFDRISNLENIDTSLLNELLKFEGLKLSTISKFLYFKRLKMNDHPCLILDQRIINALTSNRFHDRILSRFNGLKYETAISFYPIYLAFNAEISARYNTEPDQIELFLFNDGMNLKKPVKHRNGSDA